MRGRLGFLVPVVLPCVLLGCGGGGGGGSGSSPPSPPPPPANTAPTITTTSFSVDEDAELASVIAATDAQGHAVTFELVTDAQHGTVSDFTSSGEFTYQGATDFSGNDTFTVRAMDSQGAAATATITVTVVPVNDPPSMDDASFTVLEDTDLAETLTALDVDGDALTFSVASDPEHGQLISFSADGTFTYRPESEYSGADSFEVRVSDTEGSEIVGTVSITVSAVNDAPTVRDDVITASGASPLIDVLANDTDPDGETLTLTLEGDPDFGTATVENGRIRLALPAGFQGFDTFTYRATDAAGEGATARVVVFIDSEPVRFFYVTNEDAELARNLYVDDLLSRRRATSFDSDDATVLGPWVFVSKNGRTVLFDEVDNTGVGGRKFWTAVPADGSAEPRRINAPLAAGETIELASDLSPDGHWVAFRIRDANAESRYYLADLTSDEAPREIVAPAGAAAIEATSMDIVFDEQSQYFFVPVWMNVSGDLGMTLYRASVNDPSTLQLFFSPAVAGRLTYAAFAEMGGARTIVISYEPSGTRVYLTRATDPTNPVPLTPAIADPDLAMGDYRVDWVHNRLLFNVDSQPWITPVTSTVHIADLATGDWTALGDLPADLFGPQLWEIHASGTTALFSTWVDDGMTGLAEEIREVDLVSGAPTRLFERTGSGLLGGQYTNDGEAVLLASFGSIQVAPRNDPTNPKALFTEASMSNYRFSPDGKIISVAAAPFSDPLNDDSVYAVNQTTAAGTFTKRLVQVTNREIPYVGIVAVAPRY